jgi:eukaryotic-like serine/threonine-protein kinase
VLDFGLAKTLDEPIGHNSSNSATLGSVETVAGAILGTAGYMSPEQAKGMMVVRRTDIFAFGCVVSSF